MVLSPGGSTGLVPPDVIRELLSRISDGRKSGDADLTPKQLRAYLHPLVKRVVLTGVGPCGLARWVRRQRGVCPVRTTPLSVVAELTTRLVEVLLPSADPFTATVIDRPW